MNLNFFLFMYLTENSLLIQLDKIKTVTKCLRLTKLSLKLNESSANPPVALHKKLTLHTLTDIYLSFH